MPPFPFAYAAAEDLKQLDSSIKRNSALVKKLKAVAEDTAAGILEEIRSVNMSRYVAEAAASIAECGFRVRDVPSVVAVCSALHQRYAEFGAELLSALGRLFPHKSSKATVEGGAAAATPAEERAMAARRRVGLRLITELVLVRAFRHAIGHGMLTLPTTIVPIATPIVLQAGVTGEMGPLGAGLQDLCSVSWHRDREEAAAALALVANYASTYRFEVLGGSPPDPDTLSLPGRARGRSPPEDQAAAVEGEAQGQTQISDAVAAALADYEAALSAAREARPRGCLLRRSADTRINCNRCLLRPPAAAAADAALPPRRPAGSFQRPALPSGECPREGAGPDELAAATGRAGPRGGPPGPAGAGAGERPGRLCQGGCPGGKASPLAASIPGPSGAHEQDPHPHCAVLMSGLGPPQTAVA